MKGWTPAEIIVLVMALTISAILLISVAHPLFTGIPPTEEKVALIAGVVTTMLAAIVYFLGGGKPPDKKL